MSDFKQSAQNIINALGGASNVTDVENCITRIRATLIDPSKVDEAALKALPETMGVVVDQTTQIILGPGKVDKTADALDEILASTPQNHAPAEDLGEKGASIKAEQKQKNNTPLKNFFRQIANIFVPLIPALIGCGIIAALNGLLSNLITAGMLVGLKPLLPVLKAVSTAFMSFLPIFVGMNAAKEFGGTPVIGGAVAAIIPFAGVADIKIAGEALVPGRGGVLGAMFAAILAAYLERWARKWAPDSISMLIVPTVAILGAGLITIYVLMNVFGYVADGIGIFANWLLAKGGIVAGPVLAGLFLPLVMLGLHQALIPIHTTLIEQNGYTTLLPILSMAGAGQVGAAFAIYKKLKHNKELKQTIKSALPAGLLGVGEPLIYGVTLPLGRPFITACIGGAFGGAFVGLMYQLGDTVGSKAYGPSGWALFPLLDGSKGLATAAVVYGGGLLMSYIAGYLITYFFGFSKATLEEAGEYSEISEKEHGELV